MIQTLVAPPAMQHAFDRGQTVEERSGKHARPFTDDRRWRHQQRHQVDIWLRVRPFDQVTVLLGKTNNVDPDADAQSG